MKLKATLIALSLTAFALPVLAQNQAATPSIEKRLDNQEKRIEAGEKSGALTPREANRLEMREAKTKANLIVARSDGKVTKAERVRLHKKMNRNSRAIHRLKHNRQHS
ncbi:MAG: hypothetical protein WAO76_16845 [Georgfuchsia sp.]